jgi:MFS family permease
VSQPLSLQNPLLILVAGLGGAGIFSGAISIMVITIPLHKRPVFQGIFGAVFGVASICGPLVGGVFTTKVSWRWCFYINLPVGAVVAGIILLILKTPPSKNVETTRQRLMKLDPLGTIVFLPAIICLLLALQWGGTTYAWSNARIIALFILAGLLLILFMYIQYRGGDNATIPLHIIKQRSIASGAYFSALVPGSMMVVVYYLPIWFQAIKGVSAVHSGIDTLPLVMSLVVASILSGGATAKIGYYVPQMIACSIIMSVGTGMLTTLTPETTHDKWIAYQVIYGFGLGFGMQQAGMAAQTCLAKKDVMTGVSLMFFMQGLGGAIFVSIGQTVFTTSLVKNLSILSSINTNLTPAMIVKTGATELRNIIPAQYLPQILVAYNAALSNAFLVGVGTSVATILSGLTMEWKSVKKAKAASREAMKAKGNQGGEQARVNPELGSEATVESSTSTSSIKPVNHASESKE